MNKKIVTGIALACLLTYTPQPAQAGYISDFIDYISKNPTLLSAACKKGAASKGVFSVRSFNGAPCEEPLIAAWAITYCPGAKLDKGDKFEGSKCDTKAKAVLGVNSADVEPSKAIEAKFEDQFKSLSSSAKTTFCSAVKAHKLLSKVCKK